MAVASSPFPTASEAVGRGIASAQQFYGVDRIREIEGVLSAALFEAHARLLEYSFYLADLASALPFLQEAPSASSLSDFITHRLVSLCRESLPSIPLVGRFRVQIREGSSGSWSGYVTIQTQEDQVATAPLFRSWLDTGIPLHESASDFPRLRIVRSMRIVSRAWEEEADRIIRSHVSAATLSEEQIIGGRVSVLASSPYIEPVLDRFLRTRRAALNSLQDRARELARGVTHECVPPGVQVVEADGPGGRLVVFLGSEGAAGVDFCLGRGANSDVFLGCRIPETGAESELRWRAVKLFRGVPRSDEEHNYTAVTEAARASFIPFFKFGRVASAAGDVHVSFLEMELCLGTLDDLVRSLEADEYLTRSALRSITREVAVCVAALHYKGFVHRKLHPGTILLTLDNNWRLGDPGFLQRVGRDEFSYSFTLRDQIMPPEVARSVLTSRRRAGLDEIIAPEVVLELRDQALLRSRKVDVFVLGEVFFFLATKSLPFGSGSVALTELSRRAEDIRPNVDAIIREVGLENSKVGDFAELVSLMLSVDPANRLSSSDIMDHPFFWDDHKFVTWVINCDNWARGALQDSALPAPSVLTELRSDRRVTSQLIKSRWWNDVPEVLRKNVVAHLQTNSVTDALRFLRNHIVHLGRGAREDLDCLRREAGVPSSSVPELLRGCSGLSWIVPSLERFFLHKARSVHGFETLRFVLTDERQARLPDFSEVRSPGIARGESTTPGSGIWIHGTARSPALWVVPVSVRGFAADGAAAGGGGADRAGSGGAPAAQRAGLLVESSDGDEESRDQAARDAEATQLQRAADRLCSYLETRYFEGHKLSSDDKEQFLLSIPHLLQERADESICQHLANIARKSDLCPMVTEGECRRRIRKGFERIEKMKAVLKFILGRDVEKDIRVMDIGCGDGTTTSQVARVLGLEPANVIGVEPELPGVPFTKSSMGVVLELGGFSFFRYPGDEFILHPPSPEDAEVLRAASAANEAPVRPPFPSWLCAVPGTPNFRVPDDSVNIITSNLVFHHIPVDSLDLIIREISRVLKPGGLVVLLEHDAAQTNLFKRAFLDAIHHIKQRVFVPEGLEEEMSESKYRSASEWTTAFERFGFQQLFYSAERSGKGGFEDWCWNSWIVFFKCEE